MDSGLLASLNPGMTAHFLGPAARFSARGLMIRHCEPKAKQSNFTFALDCFVAVAPRNDDKQRIKEAERRQTRSHTSRTIGRGAR
jgi:hypothetical protein